MKRLTTSAMIILFLFMLTACGIFGGQTATFSGETKTYEFSHEENGMAMNANMEVGQKITVKATLENVSGETIVYNSRCGIPFYIHAEMEGTSAQLNMNTNQKIVDCDDMFDPNDLEEFPTGETIEKNVTFKRQFELSNGFKTPAHDGDYNIQFTFRTYENGDLQSEFPIALTHNSDPEISTVEEAKTYSLEHSEVKSWFDQQVTNDLEVVNQGAILSDGHWHLMFYTLNEKDIQRIVVAVDFHSGEVTDVNQENLKLTETNEELFS